MPKTIEQGFRIFLRGLTPSSGESLAAMRHRASIQACLRKNFKMNRFFRIGSFGNGTSIRDFSDVDYFAIIPSDNLKQNSNATLQAIRDYLDIRFPNSGVAIRTPAVLVPFGRDAKESTEVVPGEFIKRNKQGHAVYKISDGSGGWMMSSPIAHNAYVSKQDSRLRGKVKPLIRFIKAWKFYRNVPILSFYLELRVSKYASLEKDIVYSIDVKRFLQYLWNIQLAAIHDPIDISGYISPCSSDAKQTEALSKLETALMRAEKATVAEHIDRDIPNAFYWWNLFFAGLFPSYE